MIVLVRAVSCKSDCIAPSSGERRESVLLDEQRGTTRERTGLGPAVQAAQLLLAVLSRVSGERSCLAR
jgi:hypothetical protein